jgi:Domain of unknown function (DUF4266)
LKTFMLCAFVLASVLATALTLGGCAIVPQNRRAALADPILSSFDEDALEAHKRAKFYSTREAAAGGDGEPAGGGCGCQ